MVEVDLHINQLLDTTAGMNNADIQSTSSRSSTRRCSSPQAKGQEAGIHSWEGRRVLRQAIVNELKKIPSCYSQDASFKEYGFGATMVTIK